MQGEIDLTERIEFDIHLQKVVLGKRGQAPLATSWSKYIPPHLCKANNVYVYIYIYIRQITAIEQIWCQAQLPMTHLKRLAIECPQRKVTCVMGRSCNPVVLDFVSDLPE